MSETGWVKFVCIDACYAGVPDEENQNDMSLAFGMGSEDNSKWFGDQSYIAFDNVTPGG